MASFSWQPASAFAPPGRLVIPREVGAWAEIEEATLIAPPTARWNKLGAVITRATRSSSPRSGAPVRRVIASGGPVLGCGTTFLAATTAAFVWGPAVGAPFLLSLGVALVLGALLAVVVIASAAEMRAGPMIEVEGDLVRVPRLGVELGRGERPAPLVLRLEHAVRYDDGVLMQRFCLPAVWHEGGMGRSVVVLPAPMREKAAERLLRRLLDRPPTEKLRVVEISSEELRKGSMPSGD